MCKTPPFSTYCMEVHMVCKAVREVVCCGSEPSWVSILTCVSISTTLHCNTVLTAAQVYLYP